MAVYCSQTPLDLIVCFATSVHGSSVNTAAFFHAHYVVHGSGQYCMYTAESMEKTYRIDRM